MKLRYGFVSNSSTTSFCIIGVDDTHAQELLKACGYNMEWYQDTVSQGIARDPHTLLAFYGNYNDLWYVGVDAETLLDDKTYPEARKWFVKYVESMGVDLEIGNVKLYYGEAGTG